MICLEHSSLPAHRRDVLYDGNNVEPCLNWPLVTDNTPRQRIANSPSLLECPSSGLGACGPISRPNTVAVVNTIAGFCGDRLAYAESPPPRKSGIALSRAIARNYCSLLTPIVRTPLDQSLGFQLDVSALEWKPSNPAKDDCS